MPTSIFGEDKPSYTGKEIRNLLFSQTNFNSRSGSEYYLSNTFQIAAELEINSAARSKVCDAKFWCSMLQHIKTTLPVFSTFSPTIVPP